MLDMKTGQRVRFREEQNKSVAIAAAGVAKGPISGDDVVRALFAI